jgi:hypothetical protein
MSSNDYIDELCPISSAKNAKQCLIFLLPENQKSRRYIKSVRAALKSIDLNSTLPNIHFSHVYTNRQTDFVSAFKPSEYDEVCIF